MISYDFNGGVAIVTGASRGIGKVVARELLDSNCIVVGTYASDEITAEQCRSEFTEYSGRFELVRSDVSIHREITRLFDYATEKYSKAVTLLVNNAGILKQGPFLELTGEQWDRTFDVNIKGPFFLCQEFLKRNKNGGSIVNISSVGGQTGGDKAPDYAATKAAMISLTRSIAKLGSEKNIRSNAVAPGWIKTEIFSEEQLTNLEQQARQMIPLARMGAPDEVAKAVLFLLSDASSYITGHCINVNGGMYFG